MTGNLRWTLAGERVRFASRSTLPSLMEASFRTADRTDHLELASSGMSSNSAQLTSYGLLNPMRVMRSRLMLTERGG